MTDVAALAAGAGSGMAAGAVLWYAGLRYRLRQDIEAVLAADDPAARMAAVDVVASHGIASVAKSLLARVEVEHDEAVLDAIAAAVYRSQWEPLASPELVALRLWAAHRRQEAPPPSPDRPRGGRLSVAAGRLTPGPVDAPAGVVAGGPLALRPPPRFSADAYIRRDRPIVVVDADTPVGAAVVAALHRMGHRVVAVALGLPGTSAVPASASGAPTVDQVTSASSRVWSVRLEPGPGSPVGASSTTAVGTAIIGLAQQVDAAAVLTPTAAAIDSLLPVRYALLAAGIAATLPVPGATSGRSTPAGGSSAAGRREPGPPGAGPGSPLHTFGSTGTVRGFVAEVVVDGRQVAGQVVLEPLGPGTALPDSSAPASWPGAAGHAVRARAVTNPVLHDVVAAAVRSVGASGPMHVRGGTVDGGTPWVTGVDVGFSRALPLALATGADLVGLWLAVALGRPLGTVGVRYEDGLVVVHHRPARSTVTPSASGVAPSPWQAASGGPFGAANGAGRALGS